MWTAGPWGRPSSTGTSHGYTGATYLEEQVLAWTMPPVGSDPEAMWSAPLKQQWMTQEQGLSQQVLLIWKMIKKTHLFHPCRSNPKRGKNTILAGVTTLDFCPFPQDLEHVQDLIGPWPKHWINEPMSTMLINMYPWWLAESLTSPISRTNQTNRLPVAVGRYALLLA